MWSAVLSTVPGSGLTVTPSAPLLERAGQKLKYYIQSPLQLPLRAVGLDSGPRFLHRVSSLLISPTRLSEELPQAWLRSQSPLSSPPPGSNTCKGCPSNPTSMVPQTPPTYLFWHLSQLSHHPPVLQPHPVPLPFPIPHLHRNCYFPLNFLPECVMRAREKGFLWWVNTATVCFSDAGDKA